ncbi:hypothetical protein TFHFJT_130034 [Tenacibaculum finnmarkense]|nr:hypothetical protein TFHFJT_130034 [Tenacibaculum finnmarkense]
MKIKALLIFVVFFTITVKSQIIKQGIFKSVPCYTVYTVCDRASGDSYNKFDSCMQNNDC